MRSSSVSSKVASSLLILALSFLGPFGSFKYCAAKAEEPNPGQLPFQGYVIGSGDRFFIELLDVPEISTTASVGPDGVIYLPKLRALYVEGLTLDELRLFLTEQYRAIIKEPVLYITPTRYRPVRVYIGGEVNRPGYYTLSTQEKTENALIENTSIPATAEGKLDAPGIRAGNSDSNKWPTLFDAIQASRGITAYSKLDQITVTRKRSASSGGGHLRATVDFTKLLSEGDESVNIKLFDGDVINIKRSDTALREQLLAATQTNLSPEFIQVFISGRVNDPGPKVLPQGSTLNQAIASAGGPRLLRGSILFVRLGASGETDARRFSFSESAQPNTYKNPVLMQGDIVRVNDSFFSAGVQVLNEITGPAVGVYSIYSLFKP